MFRSTHVYITTVLLILLTLQNAVGELYMHDFLHENHPTVINNYHHHDGDGHAHVVGHCSCWQDFLNPGNNDWAVLDAVPTFQYVYAHYCCKVIFVIQDNIIKKSLRGPPAV